MKEAATGTNTKKRISIWEILPNSLCEKTARSALKASRIGMALQIEISDHRIRFSLAILPLPEYWMRYAVQTSANARMGTTYQ